ncbi:signal peptidase I [Cellulomonas biazotea]|uniref:Peptidase S26 domain-containing protein n=1 Tax=Cellulomonas biazotea TaxID=1709 RepID=A0A402DTM8_9CELL|nr:signal peptidase I [Cellulomonas biazotea]GCE77483.1 hypothetical protein CBZ_25390 [Cellulomonas biazotea]
MSADARVVPGQGPAPARGRWRRPAARALRVLRDALLDVGAVVGTAAVVAVAVCLFAGVRPAIVVSGSMAPGIPVGALTVARTVPADAVAVGTVVTLPRPDGHGLVTHRVVASEPGPAGATRLTLQGDASSLPDPVPYDVRDVGVVLGSVPRVGAAVAWLQQHLVVVVLGLVALLALATVPARRRPPADEATRSGTS